MRKLLILIAFIAICPIFASPQAPPPAPAKPAQPPPDTLLDGTPVKLRLAQTISSADARTGQDVPFEVVEELILNGVTVLPKGAEALGTITEAEPKRRMGRGGKLDISISYARLGDREKVALRASKEAKGGGHVGAMTAAMVGSAILFFPAAPLFLFMHGKDITIPQGTEITAYIEGDMHLEMARFALPKVDGPQTPVAVPPKTGPPSLNVDSTPAGADIEIDGAFVGNTPSTITVAPGDHEVTVKKNGFTDWTRKLSVTGGSIHLGAELEPVKAQ